MNKEEFVQLIYEIGEGTVDCEVGCLEKPPGRQPYASMIARSQWYAGLSDHDKTMIREVIRFAAQFAIFGVLCEFDGVGGVAGNPEDGMLEIRFRKAGEETLITDPDQEELHGLYRSLIEW
ncbi:MAG: hypothetical protein J0H49_35960 [Acidobacteria bacterium]|nr:hypothetical protein [Acidobacteriota bacterium]